MKHDDKRRGKDLPEQSFELKIFELETRMRKYFSDQMQILYKKNKEDKSEILGIKSSADINRNEITAMRAMVNKIQTDTFDAPVVFKKIADLVFINEINCRKMQ